MEIGTSINHYEILDKLGEGGMGVVYKATDTKLRRTVALKFLPPHLTQSKSDQQRFLREARAAASLNHSNICGIHAVEEFEDQHFISMEFIDGVTLGDKLKSGELTTATALECAVEIADALAEAHENGIVHRDIKPGNIMVDSKDRIKVMDFGLAKLAGSAPITKSGTTVGTMAYMAPEQIQGRPVDHRADLFSFGVLLFEMLTGQRPFTGQYDAALSYSIVHEDPPKLSEMLPDAPEKLSLLVSRLLEKDPAKRYSDSEQLAVELKACLVAMTDDVATSRISQTVTSQQTNSTGSGSTSITLNFPSLQTPTGVLSLAGLLAMVLLVGYWLYPSSDTQATPRNNKIAVLPLESISQEPEDIQFTDGVHEELINRLAGIRDLTVIARSSVLGFEPGQRDLQSIGEQLDVTSLMEGTVRRIENELRVSVQLIDVKSLGTLWSGSFDENLDNVFELQSRIARQVAGELQASLTPEEQKRLDERPTDNPEAYKLYMLGREYTTFENEDRLLMAEEYYKLAIEEDPDFTHAWAKLAGVNHILYWRYERTPERREALESAAKQAEALDPDLPETKLAMGLFYRWSQTDHRQSLNYFLSALEQFPNEHTLHREIGYVYRHMGNWEMSIKYWERSIELNPVGLLSAGVAYTYWLMRDYEKALTYLGNLKEVRPESVLYFAYKAKTILSKDGTLEGYEQWWDHLRPSDPSIEQTEYWIEYKVLKRDWNEIILTLQNIQGEILINDEVEYLLKDYLFGRAIERQGNNSEARVYYERAKNHLEALVDEYPDEARYHSELGKVYARLGDVQKAIRSGERATQIIPISLNAVVGPNFEMNLAEIYAWTGREELAIDKLELCLSVPSVAHRNWIRLDPRWDPLRDNPRFQELIAGEDEPYIEGL